MAYSDFMPADLVNKLGLRIDERIDLYFDTSPVDASDLLQRLLTEQGPRALIINTEKAKSELIIAPILMEVLRHSRTPLSFFSGTAFNVDVTLGLIGTCDFLLTHSSEQLYIQAPVMTVVEAKNENVIAGIGQCGATMFAAQMFNERSGERAQTIHGAVTTGNTWRFLRLEEKTLFIDIMEYYYLRDLGKILAILLSSLQAPALPAGATP